MGFNCGIVGLPNVGKSTLFNALTQTSLAESENYPFCTIEPNTGRVSVPDKRLDNLAKLIKPKKTIHTQLEFVDIAGLVKDASKGEGLGNQFLGHIREVDAIAHVIRCFDDENITHVENKIDPVRDIEIIETELILADLDSLEKQASALEKKIRGQDKSSKLKLSLIEKLYKSVSEGIPIRQIKEILPNEITLLNELNLITSKPMMFVCNVSENDLLKGNEYTRDVLSKAKQDLCGFEVVSAQIEFELSQLDEDESKDYLYTLGLKEPSLKRVIKSGYELLKLITFYTAGPNEARAWTIRKGLKAPEAAGKIHSDFEKGFIKAETFSYNDFINFNGEIGAKEAGKLRIEGSEYIVEDGDIFHFRFNV